MVTGFGISGWLASVGSGFVGDQDGGQICVWVRDQCHGEFKIWRCHFDGTMK